MLTKASRRIAALSFAVFLSLNFSGLSQTTSKQPQVVSNEKAADHFVFSTTGLALEIIADELGHQYLIGIQPQTSKLDGKWHKIKIKVEPPANAAGAVKRVSARTREGFYLDQR